MLLTQGALRILPFLCPNRPRSHAVGEAGKTPHRLAQGLPPFVLIGGVSHAR